jgi:hypothetical protein
MRRAEWPVPGQSTRGSPAGDGLDSGHLEGFVGIERREDRREPAGEHRLAGTRRPRQHEVVRTRGRDLERDPRGREAAHVDEVERLGAEHVFDVGAGRRCLRLRPFQLALEALPQLGQRARPHLHAG